MPHFLQHFPFLHVADLILKDNIESNIQGVAADTSAAASELRTASDYQRKAGRRAACLMIIVVVVVAVVLVAVRVCPRAQTSTVC